METKLNIYQVIVLVIAQNLVPVFCGGAIMYLVLRIKTYKKKEKI